MNDFNTAIIEEFRANAGKVGGGFEGAPMVLLHTTGAKSGEDRVAPLVYRSEGDRVVIFASKGGAPTHPDWYHNIVANPAVTVEIGDETYAGTATVLEGAERERIWNDHVAVMPGFGEYEASAAPRVIPVVAITRS